MFSTSTMGIPSCQSFICLEGFFCYRENSPIYMENAVQIHVQKSFDTTVPVGPRVFRRWSGWAALQKNPMGRQAHLPEAQITGKAVRTEP